jgi:hypothetical protein
MFLDDKLLSDRSCGDPLGANDRGNHAQFVAGPRLPLLPEGRVVSGLEDPQQDLHPAQDEQRTQVDRMVFLERTYLRVGLQERVPELVIP